MGCSLIHFSKDSYPTNEQKKHVVNNYTTNINNSTNINNLGNPDPNRYSVLKADIINGYLIIKIKYFDCYNYEGDKILVYDKGIMLEKLMNQKLIDPHFSDKQEYISPIARFEPTERGWYMAIKFCQGMK